MRGFANTEVFDWTGSFGGSLGAVRTFHSGLTNTTVNDCIPLHEISREGQTFRSTVGP